MPSNTNGNGKVKLPSSPDSEKIILASVLRREVSPSALEASMTPDDFCEPLHQDIARAFVRLGKNGDAISYTTVYEELVRRKVEVTVSQLTELIDPLEIPKAADVDAFIRTVRMKAMERKLYYACQKTMDKILLGDSGSDTLEWTQKALSDLSFTEETKAVSSMPGEVVEEGGGFQRYIMRRSEKGIPYPLPEMNSKTHGIHDGQLVIISGATSKGKTALALNIAHCAAKKGYPVDIFSMEMSKEEVVDRLFCIEGRVDSQRIRTPLTGDAEKIMAAATAVMELPIHVCDRGSVTLPFLEKNLRKAIHKHGTKLAIVDYIGLMTPSGRSENRAQEVGKITRGLKMLAVELKIPIIAVCQLNRAPDKEERRPMLSDLRESGSIEQDANVVWFVHSKRAYVAVLAAQWQEAELILAKQRNGPAGNYWPVNFCPAWGLFAEIENQEEHEQRDDQPKHRDNKKRERGKKQEQAPPPAGPEEQYGFTDRDMQ